MFLTTDTLRQKYATNENTRKAYFIIHEFCQNCNLAKLSERIFTIESMKLHQTLIHYTKLSMCKTLTVWRQHTPPWYHQQL